VTGALIRKELRDQRSFLGLGIFLCVAETLEMLLIELPDQRPLWINWTRELTADGNGILVVIIALAMAWGLLVRSRWGWSSPSSAGWGGWCSRRC